MASDDYKSRASETAVRTGRAEPTFGLSIFLRRAARQRGYIAASLVSGFILGVAYRFRFDLADERSLANFLRSGFHGVGVALTVWTVQAGFALGAQSRLGAALRRLPLAAEVLVRALAMTAALIVVGLALQFLLYAEPYHLDWLTAHWLTTNLPSIVALGFGISLVIGVTAEIQRLIGGALLTSVLLGTYHRPVPSAADRHVPRPRQFDPPRRGDGRASGARPHHALLLRHRRADRRLRRRRARLCRRRGHRHLAGDGRPGAERAMRYVLLRHPAQDGGSRGRLRSGIRRRAGVPGRDARGRRRRQRMRRRQAPARLFRRHDERRGAALRILQDDQSAPGDFRQTC